MSNSRPYIGKDGNRYSDIYERDAANTRYDQRQKLIEEQQEANRLAKEQNERIKNGGYTDSEMIINSINSSILFQISKKHYQSEISNGLAVFILILYVVAIISSFIVGFTSTVNNAYIKYIIGGTIFIHIYLKICIYIMEKSITKNEKRINTSNQKNKVNKNLKLENQITINLENSEDKLLKDSIEIVIKSGQASISFLQRELNISYSKAQEIINKMEEEGIISKSQANIPREVLITESEWEKIKIYKNKKY